MLLVVFVILLLNGYIRQVYHHVVHIRRIRRVFLVTKAGKALRTQPDLQRLITRHKYVDSQVKFFAANQQWTVNISADYVRLSLHVGLERHLRGRGPLLQLTKLLHKKDSCSLRALSRFHDPRSIWVFLKLFYENHVVLRQHVSDLSLIHI